MDAIVVAEFFGVADGTVYPRTFAPGDRISGDLAELAVREGWAEEAPSELPPDPPAGD